MDVVLSKVQNISSGTVETIPQFAVVTKRRRAREVQLCFSLETFFICCDFDFGLMKDPMVGKDVYFNNEATDVLRMILCTYVLPLYVVLCLLVILFRAVYYTYV